MIGILGTNLGNTWGSFFAWIKRKFGEILSRVLGCASWEGKKTGHERREDKAKDVLNLRIQQNTAANIGMVNEHRAMGALRPDHEESERDAIVLKVVSIQ